jgi:hypothetical protein
LLRHIRDSLAGFRLARKAFLNSCAYLLQLVRESISGFGSAGWGTENSNPDTHTDACCEREHIPEYMTLTTAKQALSPIRQVTRMVSDCFFRGCRRVTCLIQKVCASFKQSFQETIH